MSLVITGAGGALGRLAAQRLLERVDPADVVLVTRNPDALADLAGRGAAVRRGDFDDPASLGAAFAGGERLLLVSTDALGADRVTQQRTAIDAAREAGIAHVAYTSIPNPVPANPAAVVPDHAATEEHLAASGMHWTFLRNALYSEFQIPAARAAIASGELRHNTGEGRTAYVSREDCAAAAAAVLAGGDEHDDRIYDITGSELLGAADLAALFGRLSDATVRAVAVDDDALVAGMVSAGVPEAGARLAASFGAAIRDGYLDQVSGDVATLTGREPATIESVLAPGLAA